MHSGNVGNGYEQHGFAAFGRVTGWRGLLNGVAVKPESLQIRLISNPQKIIQLFILKLLHIQDLRVYLYQQNETKP